jgi:hypothetical protein
VGRPRKCEVGEPKLFDVPQTLIEAGVDHLPFGRRDVDRAVDGIPDVHGADHNRSRVAARWFRLVVAAALLVLGTPRAIVLN